MPYKGGEKYLLKCHIYYKHIEFQLPKILYSFKISLIFIHTKLMSICFHMSVSIPFYV